MSNKYKHGKYRISIADDKDIQNKVVSITDDKGNDALGGGGGGLKPTLVDITKYPTLQDFLASEGKDGNIYLYPNGKTGAESRYYEYMWLADEQRYELIDSLDMDYDNLTKKPSINGVELSGNKTSNELGVYSKPSGGIPESDLSSDVQQALQKHFKGWYASSNALPDNPVVGDYAYVKGAESTDPAAIYECTTDGSWSNSGRTADTSNVQTFASGQEVNEVHIVNDLTTGGVADVLSAEQGKVLGDIINDTNQYTDLTIDEGYYWATVQGSPMPQSKTVSSTTSAYGCIRVQCSAGDKFRIFGKGGNQYGYLWTFTDSSREILSQKNTDYYQSNGDVITAPASAYYLYVNLYQYNSSVDKVQSEISVAGLVTRVEELESKTIPNVVNNLNSNSTTDALSANQGKILNEYTDGLAGVVIEDVAEHSTNNTIIKNVLKNAWIEIIDETVTIPQTLRLYLLRNRSTGTGSHFIMQFADAQQFDSSHVIFSNTQADKLIGKNSVIVNGAGATYANKVKLHFDLDFTEESGNIEIEALDDCYLYTEQLHKEYIRTESVKEAVERIDEEVSIKFPLGNISGVGTMGASLMYNGNNWVEDGCKLCGVTSYNKAESGVGVPSYFADKIWRGTYCTDAEFEAMDILAIQFASSGDVYTGTFFDTSSEYVEDFDIEDETNQFAVAYTPAQCLDYILKYWQERCYACRNDSDSKWYNTQYGKPCRLMFVTHWHDARVGYNDSIRQVAAKWGGGICEFDKKIGFSKNQPIGTLQPSVIYANETETISGVAYGWHPLRGSAGAYIQTKMANIFASSLMEYFSMN